MYYIRSETKQLINVGLSDSIKNILNEFQPLTGDDKENYIFPILDKNVHVTQTQIANRNHKIMGQINKDLKEIAKILDIDIYLVQVQSGNDKVVEKVLKQ